MTQEIQVQGDVDFATLVKLVSLETGRAQTHTAETVQAVLDIIGRSLAEGRKVKVSNFGTFEPTTHTMAAGALGGRIAERTEVQTVRFHITGRLREAVRSGVPADTLRKASKSF